MFTGTSDEVCDTLTKLIQLGRLAKPDEVAAATLFCERRKQLYDWSRTYG